MNFVFQKEKSMLSVIEAQELDASMRVLIDMAKAMLTAKDQVETVERAVGWERLKTLVAEVDKVAARKAPLLGFYVRRWTGWATAGLGANTLTNTSIDSRPTTLRAFDQSSLPRNHNPAQPNIR